MVGAGTHGDGKQNGERREESPEGQPALQRRPVRQIDKAIEWVGAVGVNARTARPGLLDLRR
jgi:hypothetical protein